MKRKMRDEPDEDLTFEAPLLPECHGPVCTTGDGEFRERELRALRRIGTPEALEAAEALEREMAEDV